MRGNYNSILAPKLQAFDPKDAALERQPFFIPFEPGVAVAGGATVTVDFTQPYRDFVWTGFGLTSGTLGFPAAPGRWRISIEDVGAQRVFQPANFDATAVIGGNFGISDNSFAELPVPWVFMEKTTIRVQFENRDPVIANLPSLVMVGYLTNWQREANAAIRLQELNLASLENQAGMGAGFQR